MSTFAKKYPRAKVSRHATLNGWVIDIIMGAKSRPSRVKATYATIPFAVKAAHAKLGVPTSPGTAPVARADGALVNATKQPERAPKNAGTCKPCGRPMRPAGTKAADYPGAVVRQREGLCQSCNYSSKKAAR